MPVRNNSRRERVRKLIAEGRSLREMARLEGCHKGTIQALVKRLRIDAKRKRLVLIREAAQRRFGKLTVADFFCGQAREIVSGSVQE